MSSIKFDIGVSTEKLTEELKKANQSFAEFERSAVQSGQKVDQSFQKSTATLRQEVGQQKQLIKEIENEIKNASDARDKMARMQDKSNANVELGAMKRSLAEENQKLLNLQGQQIAGNQKEKESQGGIISSLKDWAIGLATAGAAIKIFKSIAESTEASSQMFEEAVAGMTSGVSYFFKTIASGDWKGFGTGLKTAITGAVEHVSAMEHINNLKNEQKVRSANLDIELGKNWQNVNSTDQSVKIQALKNIKELTKTKLTQEAKLANDVYAVHKTALAKENGLSEQEIENVSSNWSKIEDEVEKGQKVLKARAVLGTKNGLWVIGGGAAYSKEEKAAAFDYLKSMGEFNKGVASEADKYAAIATKYGKVTGKERGILSTEQAAGLSATAAIDLEGKRVAMRLAAAQREARSAEELGNRITEVEKKMQFASAGELPILADKLALLYREKTLWEEKLKLAKSVMSVTKLKGVTDNVDQSNQGAILSGFVGSISKSTSADVKSDQAEIDRAKLKMKLSDEAYQKEQDHEEWIQKRKDENIKKQKKVTLELLDAVFKLTMQIGEKLGMTQEQSQILASAMNSTMDFAKKGFKNLVSGDWIGAVVGLISGVISLIPTHAQKFKAQIEDINKLLEEQQRLIDKAARYGGETQARKAELKVLEDKRKSLEAEQDRLEGKKGFLGMFTGKKKLEEVNDELQKLQLEIEDADIAMKDFLSGGVTENTLADSIAQGFQEGKTSVNDFADYMNTVLLDAVMNIFKGDILADMQPLMDKVRASLGDKKLTKEEKDAITAEAKRVADENQSLWKDLTSSIDLTGGQAAQQGMAGTIQRSITEETGTELAGLFRRAADDGRVVKDYTKLGLNNLILIEKNTFETVAQLKLAVVELQSIVVNTKIQYSGKI